MSLRLKIALALVALSITATVAIGIGTYTGMRASLDKAINDSLNEVHREASEGYHYTPVIRGGDDGGRPTPRRSLDSISEQFLDGDGAILNHPESGPLPVDDRDREIARSMKANVVLRREVEIDDESFRMDTVSRGGGRGAAQFARSLDESEQLLAAIRNRTLAAVFLVIVLAASIGWWIARQVTRRLTRLTETAEHVAETGALDVTAPVDGNDEAGRLGAAFNEMLAALARSKDAQQRLAQDAGHELRTPLTSLRTNVAILARFESMSPEERAETLADLRTETRELTMLVNELVELATDQHSAEASSPVELAAIADQCVQRARRRTDRAIELTSEATTVIGQPGRLDRAISNLIDNALKFSPEHVGIEVTVAHGRVAVADRGPGISADDRTRIFERFYRSDEARSRPGSGLGLAIVHDIVVEHHGHVFAEERPGGGSVIGFVLPETTDHSSHQPLTQTDLGPHTDGR